MPLSRCARLLTKPCHALCDTRLPPWKVLQSQFERLPNTTYCEAACQARKMLFSELRAYP
jgi:hypothetical protein